MEKIEPWILYSPILQNFHIIQEKFNYIDMITNLRDSESENK